ncbi:MAG: diguanylate cyclase [Ketobacter sp.]|nr:MAG: diguanylate cyclase [Ketobacter sp.]
MTASRWLGVSINTRSSLAYQAGLSILLGALLLTLCFSFYFYDRTYREQLQTADQQLQQLFDTVENSAAVAAYLDNDEIALEVARGLSRNDIVSAAMVTSLTGMQASSGTELSMTSPGIKSFALESPFISGDTVGSITMLPNHDLIKASAQTAAWRHVFITSIQSLALVALAIFLVHRNLSAPIKRLAGQLHIIPPGSKERLQCPRNHEHDEIGLLIKDTNRLLTATQNTLDGERRLREYAESLERQFRLIFEKASCGIALVNAHGKILMHNPSLEHMLNITSTQIDIKNATFHSFFADPDQVRTLLERAHHANNPVTKDLQLKPTHDETRWLNSLISKVTDEDGEMIVECILYDISERTAREQQTQFEAERDPLTGLYNRRAGFRKIETALQQAKETSSRCAFILVDLDKFKPINDNYGHDAGDVVLKTVAHRLSSHLRQHDIVIRWGGDEFLIIVEQVNHSARIAEKLLKTLQDDIDLGDGQQASIGASIGISLFPDHGDQIEDLIQRADVAMYQVKESGRNHYAFYATAQA